MQERINRVVGLYTGIEGNAKPISPSIIAVAKQIVVELSHLEECSGIYDSQFDLIYMEWLSYGIIMGIHADVIEYQQFNKIYSTLEESISFNYPADLDKLRGKLESHIPKYGKTMKLL